MHRATEPVKCTHHFARHHREKLGEINGAVAVSIDLVNHVLQLSLGRVLTERTHNGAQLLGGDGAVTVLVEQGEGLFQCTITDTRRHNERKNASDSVLTQGAQ